MCLSLGVLGTWVLAAALAVGPDLTNESLQLDWYAAEECPGELELREQIQAMLVAPPNGPPLRASVALLPSRAGGYELQLALSQGELHEEHRLEAPACETLGGLAATLIATALDPFGFVPAEAPPILVRPRPPLQRPTRASAPQVQVAQLEAAPGLASEGPGLEAPLPTEDNIGELRRVEGTAPRRAPRRPLGGILSASAQGFVNLLPAVGGGPRLALGVEIGALRLEAGGAGWLGSGFRGGSDTAVGGQLSAWSVELGGCAVPSWRRLEFPLCARAGAGQMIGAGIGVTDPQTIAQPWVWLGADVGLEFWIVPRVALVLGLGAAGSLARPAFDIGGSDAKFDTPEVFGRIHGGLATRFGPRARTRVTDP